MFELQYLFFSELERNNNLIISGYSFGDQGINTRIINWIFKHNDRRMIIIHPDIEYLKIHSRGAIFKMWPELSEAGAIKVINKKIQNVFWQEIRDELI